ncbi:MAG TPA: helix-turn-helix transcriptional regulator [Alphaproteobacteria bacterium]|mgnify:CR=1 FL=1|nr:helix-turn-helix transcriptional regulator [Alphaproteobacteria bacterium]HOO50159.1 helix-turn-helix transcriptional regulator [Alphaproteobacteria bacterium]
MKEDLAKQIRNPRRSSVNGEEPNPVDVFVGQKLRSRRNLIGITQENLAEAAGITFQQVQKYEKGRNRLSASRLFQFSRVLDVPVSYFFDGFAASDSQIGIQAGFAENDQDAFIGEGDDQEDILHRKETVELIRTYYGIADERLRKDFLKMLKQMAKNFKANE